MRSKCNCLIEKGNRMLLHFMLMFALVFAVALAVSATANAEDVTEEAVEVNQSVINFNNGQFPDIADEDKNYKLTGNITIPDTWYVSGNTTLDFNGYGINVSSKTSVICVGQSAKLKLKDTDTTKTHYLVLKKWQFDKFDENEEEVAIDENGNGVVKVKGGFITGGQGKDGTLAGGGIVVTGGNTMGTIAGGRVIMENGTIIGNTDIVSEDFDYGGAGVFVDAQGTFEMNGGMITYNHAEVNGGGVGLHGTGCFTHTGGKIIGNNAKGNGGGVFAAGNYGKYILKGGTVTNNTASLGGGVSVRGHGVFEMLSGSVTGNRRRNR